MRTGNLKDHLEKLAAFKSVVDAGSISKASEILNLSQSSLSHSIMTLEDALDTKLLERKSRGVSATDSGNIVYEFSKRLHLDVMSVESRLIAPTEENSGHIRIATHETLAVHVWPNFLKALKEEYPQIHISLFSGRVDSVVDGVINGDYHLSVSVEPTSHPKIEKVKLYGGSFGLFAGPKANCNLLPQLKKTKLTLDELKEVPIMTDGHAHIKQGLPIPMYLAELQLGNPLSYEVNSFEAAIRLASQGLGIAAIPTKNAEEALKQKLIRKIRVQGISEKSFGNYNICAAFKQSSSNQRIIEIVLQRLKAFFD